MPFTLDPEVAAAFLDIIGPNPPARPPLGDVESRRLSAQAFFALGASLASEVTDVDTRDYHPNPPDGHRVLCRLFTKINSASPGSAVLYIHGGGMIAASLDDYDFLIKQLVSKTGVPILAVEYRLAPEFRAPAQVVDAYIALRFLHANASSIGVDPKRIAIMGDSAGGGIAAALAHFNKQRDNLPIAKQILIYPMLDDGSNQPDPNLDPHLAWTIDDNITGWRALLGTRYGRADTTPIDVPARMTVTDAQGLPPAYIDVGELDLFRNEDIEYAQTLGRAGVSCELHVWPGVPHGWELLAPHSTKTRVATQHREAAILSI